MERLDCSSNLRGVKAKTQDDESPAPEGCDKIRRPLTAATSTADQDDKQEPSSRRREMIRARPTHAERQATAASARAPPAPTTHEAVRRRNAIASTSYPRKEDTSPHLQISRERTEPAVREPLPGPKSTPRTPAQAPPEDAAVPTVVAPHILRQSRNNKSNEPTTRPGRTRRP